ESVVKKVVDKYSEKHGKKIIAGYRNGYYSPDQENSIALEISETNPDILFVAITSPKKEIFLEKYKSIIKAPFIMGVGGSFDVVAGKVKRAPLWMQRFGLEWFYRVIQEPKRLWRRYFNTNLKFIKLLISEKMYYISSHTMQKNVAKT
ncbi:MAG: WecB/TagA/CpsF family glycosyltransferase, partial [Cyclobacteriaceae bacterium]|nr:WecB/TagA/CpsF family glycosyltransferase [Cyclobacteriaceae bacterium]